MIDTWCIQHFRYGTTCVMHGLCGLVGVWATALFCCCILQWHCGASEGAAMDGTAAAIHRRYSAFSNHYPLSTSSDCSSYEMSRKCCSRTGLCKQWNTGQHCCTLNHSCADICVLQPFPSMPCLSYCVAAQHAAATHITPHLPHHTSSMKLLAEMQPPCTATHPVITLSCTLCCCSHPVLPQPRAHHVGV